MADFAKDAAIRTVIDIGVSCNGLPREQKQSLAVVKCMNNVQQLGILIVINDDHNAERLYNDFLFKNAQALTVIGENELVKQAAGHTIAQVEAACRDFLAGDRAAEEKTSVQACLDALSAKKEALGSADGYNVEDLYGFFTSHRNALQLMEKDDLCDLYIDDDPVKQEAMVAMKKIGGECDKFFAQDPRDVDDIDRIEDECGEFMDESDEDEEYRKMSTDLDKARVEQCLDAIRVLKSEIDSGEEVSEVKLNEFISTHYKALNLIGLEESVNRVDYAKAMGTISELNTACREYFSQDRGSEEVSKVNAFLQDLKELTGSISSPEEFEIEQLQDFILEHEDGLKVIGKEDLVVREGEKRAEKQRLDPPRRLTSGRSVAQPGSAKPAPPLDVLEGKALKPVSPPSVIEGPSSPPHA